MCVPVYIASFFHFPLFFTSSLRTNRTSASILIAVFVLVIRLDVIVRIPHIVRVPAAGSLFERDSHIRTVALRRQTREG